MDRLLTNLILAMVVIWCYATSQRIGNLETLVRTNMATYDQIEAESERILRQSQRDFGAEVK